jgi:LmbE family N-acetylglucosaminyl deacetylase
MRAAVLGTLIVGIALATGRALEPLPQDVGAAGTHQKLLKLRTIASVMHTTAHPDDEHGGLLAWLSRGSGARVSLLTLTRGEGGDNLLGPQLFDALGLIRTEELLAANRYYGVDAQYFTDAIDYGFSKRLDEAVEKWGRENVVRQVVRIIRMERPLVIVSRFQGTDRDGHGNHQMAGLVTLDAFRAAGDPKQFPDQIAEGLRPWQPRKAYIGGLREGESWNVRVDTGLYSPWLGMSYADFARIGLSYQRSQNSGRQSLAPGPQYAYYQRVDATVGDRSGADIGPSAFVGARENGFFDGVSTSLTGLFSAIQRPAPDGADARLREILDAANEAVQRFAINDPSASVPALARGLSATRAAIQALAAETDAVFFLRRKEAQFVDAINTAMGIGFTAFAEPAAAGAADVSTVQTMGPAVPGETFSVRATFVSRGTQEVMIDGVGLQVLRDWDAVTVQPPAARPALNEPTSSRFTVTVAPDAPLTSKPYFARRAFQDARYTLLDPSQFGRPASGDVATAVVRYRVAGAPVEARAAVQHREARAPYGFVTRELRVVPAIAVNASPALVVVPRSARSKRVDVSVEVVNNRAAGSEGVVQLRLPQGWTSEPRQMAFAFRRPGERAIYTFAVGIPSIADRVLQIEAVASVGDREYREGYEFIEHRDLDGRYLYRPSLTEVRGVDVETVPGLNVGYVMGIGDRVPEAIRQLGYVVTMLEEGDLARGNLSRFDAIVTGTRAYAVREDLKTYNRRLLEYVEQGGNLIVLYNTQELVPNRFAPRPGELTARAEEVSEEDSPVELLAPETQVLSWPNRISAADFSGWVEQRGSKFWSAWDPSYRPIIATMDRGQAPQRGGWLWTRHGKGHYTYFAYAMHRQLPYGVPGAYRLLANLLALGRTKN